MKLILKNVRCAFLHLWEPQIDPQSGKESYSVSAIIPNGDPQLVKINAAIEEVAAGKWGAKAPVILKQLKAQDKVCLHSGETKAGKYDGFDNAHFIAARSPSRPIVVDRDRSPLTEKDNRPYSGAYCNVVISLWAQDSSFGQRINASLVSLQFVKDGDSFTGAVRPTIDDFDELVDEEVDFL